MGTSRPVPDPSGDYVLIEQGVYAFIPGMLPPSIDIDLRAVLALSEADRAVGTLAGLGSQLVNPHLLIPPFLRKEALASSRIEGTRADFGQLMMFEELERNPDSSSDVEEVANYIAALEFGLSYQEDNPVTLWLIRAMHDRLMQEVRGHVFSPGMFRTTQNYIGGPGARISDARYVPPPPTAVPELLENLEWYIRQPSDLPPLIRLAVMHYQFEAIHPFLDGNGRLGRLLLSLLLCKWKVMPTPLLYLSAYFERNRSEYLDCLLHVSTRGDWSTWILFFLEAVRFQSLDAIGRSERLMHLREEYRSRFQARRSGRLLQTVDLLFARPLVSIPRLGKDLDITYRAARQLVDVLVAEGILEEVTGMKKNRLYAASEISRIIVAEPGEVGDPLAGTSGP